MKPLQFHIKEHWKFPQPLDSLLPWTEACKRDERLRPSSQRPQYPTLSDALNEDWGAHLEQNSTQGL